MLAPIPVAFEQRELWISIRSTVNVDTLSTVTSFDQAKTLFNDGGTVMMGKMIGDGVEKLEDNDCTGFMVHFSKDEAIEASKAPENRADFKSNFAITEQTKVSQVLPKVSAKQITDTITSLSSFPNRHAKTSDGVKAADWIAKKWRSLAVGLDDTDIQLVAHAGGFKQKSVVLTVKGMESPDEWVVIGGHEDSTLRGGAREGSRAPGADDDASGIAGATEIIRVLAVLSVGL